MSQKYHPYPESLPTEACKALVAAALGKSTESLADQINAAYAVASYGLAMLPLSSAPPVVAAADCTLETLLAPALDGNDEMKAAAAIPWAIVLPIIFDLLQRLLKK